MNKSKVIIAILAVAVIGFVATRFIPKTEEQILVPPTEPLTPVTTTKKTTTTTTTTVTTPAATKETLPPAPTSVYKSIYKDGTYSAQGSYQSPAGPENITISVTLKDDIVIDTNAINQARDSKSVNYQNIFISNYKQYVVGKNIADVRLDKVSGSSLTGGGFNQAVLKIKTAAQV